MAAAPYIGNQDFRGYLNYLGNNSPYSGATNNYALNSLNYVGNDGGINEGALLQYNQAAPGDANGDAYYQNQARDFVNNAYKDYTGYNTNVLGTSTTASSSAPQYTSGQQALQGSIPSALQGISSSANDAAGASAATYRNSIQDTLHNLQTGQQNIDSKATNLELAKKQGTTSILDMVGRGVRSGGVQLANRNAGDSSASEALARAYGDIGRRNLSSVGNQYALGQNDVAKMQTEQNYQQGITGQRFEDNKNNIVNNIVAQAQQSLERLDSQLVSASLPDRIQIEQEKAKIKSSALGQLQQYDQQLQGGLSSLAPRGVDANRAEASRLASLGTAPDTAFNFTDQAPAQFRGTGPFASELPLFTLNKRQQTA